MKLFILLIALFGGFTGAAFADPILDGPAFAPQSVRWAPSAGIPCPVVCRNADATSLAEFEAYIFPAINNNRTYSCKSRIYVTNPSAQGFLYGNNFQAPAIAGLCVVTMANGQVIRRNQYLCLCVD